MDNGLSKAAIDAALSHRQLGEQLERALGTAMQCPIKITEHKVFSCLVADVPDGRKAIVITTPDGHQDVYPMVKNNLERVSRELVAERANTDA
jgi:hypothetical protein